MSSAKEIADGMNLDRINQPGSSDPIFFYPKEFYVFDNFSAFQVMYEDYLWSTSEHAYHYRKFRDTAPEVVEQIKLARSPHDALKIATENKDKRVENWDEIKRDVMKDVIRHKIDQHPYVLQKLLHTGNREIIEDSWRDDQWGWGKDKDGKNMLGQIWMELREEYKNEEEEIKNE